MDASGSVLGITSPSGPRDVTATRLQVSGGIAICGSLLAVTVLAACFGSGRAPVLSAFIPITATIWSLADLLTAFLLLAQFYVSGSWFLGLTSGAYALTGLLSCSYLAMFPGVLRAGHTGLGDHPITIYLWLVWHFTFPLIVVCASFGDSTFGRLVSRRKIQIYAALIVVVPLFVALFISAVIFVYHDDLPKVVTRGGFQPLYRYELVPGIIAANLGACAVLLARRKRFTPLAMCVSIALFSEALDAFLNSSAVWSSYAWHAGKLITVFTASVVLALILFDIAGVYGRLARIAKIDVLTSLCNRRAFDEHFALVFGNARRLREKIGLLIIDVDLFKKFNDTYGHPAGDECLRSVARAMANCVNHPLDLLARYGGEEFVVVLPETSLAGAFVVAENLRETIEHLDIFIDEQTVEHVTVSIGIGYVTDASKYDETILFSVADRGLYEAKHRGRNQVVLGTTDMAEATPRLAVPARNEVAAQPPPADELTAGRR